MTVALSATDERWSAHRGARPRCPSTGRGDRAALLVVQRVLWPAPPGVLVQGVDHRRPHRPDLVRHRARLPLQPHRQLRPGRPRRRADHGRGAADRRARACPTSWPCGWAWWSPRAARRAGRVPHHPALRPRAPAHPHRGDARRWPRRSPAWRSACRRWPTTPSPAPSTSDPPQSLPVAVRLHRSRSRPIMFHGNDVIAVVAVVVVHRRRWPRSSAITNTGIAVRASAESADRAMLLGIPVKRVQTIVWMHRQRARLRRRVPAGGRRRRAARARCSGPPSCVRALAACVIGGMDHLPLIFAGAVAPRRRRAGDRAGTPAGRRSWRPILFVVVLGRAAAAAAWPRRPHRRAVELAGGHRRAADPARAVARCPRCAGCCRGLLAAARCGWSLALPASCCRAAGSTWSA